MAIRARLAGLFLLVVTAAVPASGGAVELPDSATDSTMVRIRPVTPKLATLVNSAVTVSQTFRNLVGAIEKTDGIVFIAEGRCPHGVTACLSWKVRLSGGYRLLFVFINVNRPDLEIAASIGHELRHALEVLSDPGLRSEEAIRRFYQPGMSPESPRAVETAAADATGNAVFLELRRSYAGER